MSGQVWTQKQTPKYVSFFLLLEVEIIYKKQIVKKQNQGTVTLWHVREKLST